MTMEEFGEKELEILFDAMGCWENAPSKDGFSHALIGLMTRGDSKEEREEKMDQEMQVAAAESKTRQETSILIRAKIVQMKNILLTQA